LDKVYWGTEGIWSIGDFVSTTGINEEVIRKYIKMQGEDDCGQAMLEF
jgi:putative transposase